MRFTDLFHDPIWFFKQLLPLKYHTTYGENGVRKVCIWRMWFGRCFQIEEYKIAG